MKNKRFTIVAFLCAIPILMFAQTIQWAVRPTSAQLESYGELYKVRRNGKIGLIDRHERTIIPVAYDSITPFRNGYALLLNNRGDKMKIEAVVSDGDYDIQPVLYEVYATNYPWFSEGKMPVEGNSGWGYLGTDGNMAIPCQFQIAYPFSEGVASVKIKDKAYYINRDMDYLNIEGAEWGLVYASTFSGNEAVIYTKNLKGYVIDKKGRQIRPYKVDAKNIKTNSYDHSVGNKAQMYNDQVSNLAIDNSYIVYEENRMFGYKRNGRVLVPPQFESAEPVRGDYANVRFKGQNGVIRFVDGDVDVRVVDSSVKINSGVVERGRLQLSLPEDLMDATVQINVNENHGREMQVRSNTNQGLNRLYYFQPVNAPEESETVQCDFEVLVDNLILNRSSFKVNYSVYKPVIEVPAVSDEDKTSVVIKPVLTAASFALSNPTAKAKRANPSDVFYVSVAVSNNGDERGNANVILFVDEKRVGEGTISVRGHSVANAVIAVPNIKKERWAKTRAILANNGASSNVSEIHFLPFY